MRDTGYPVLTMITCGRQALVEEAIKSIPFE